MKAMIDVFDFYLLFLPCLLSSILCHWKKRSAGSASILQNSLLTVICFFLDFIVADMVYRYIAKSSILCINTVVWKWTVSVILSMFGGAIVYYSTKILVNLRCIRFKRFMADNAFGMAIFLYLIYQLVISIPKSINGWVACWYVTDYSMGFGPRFLLGSFMKWMFGPYVLEANAVLVYVAALVCIILCISFLLNKLLQCTKTEHKVALIFLVLCWLCSPGSVAALWTSENFGRLETYSLALTMIGIAGFVRIKNPYMKYLVITAVTMLSVAIYQGYVFLYYPMILVLIIGDVLQTRKEDTQKLALGFINFSLTSFAFVWFQFFASQTRFASAEDMAVSLGTMTDLSVATGALKYEFFSPVTRAYKDINIGFYLVEFPREKMMVACLMVLPIIILFVALIAKVFKTMKENKARVFHLPYVYCLAASLAVLPQYIFNVDWGRWLIATFICGFFSILYLYYVGYEEIKVAFEALQRFIIRNKILAVCVVVYLSLLSKLQGRSFSIQIHNIWEWLKPLLGFVR